MSNDSQPRERQSPIAPQRPNVDKSDSGKYDWDHDDLCGEIPRRDKPPVKETVPWIRALRQRLSAWFGSGSGFGNDDDRTPSAA